jgi:non-ribosomal peptide synthetase component E (peptide arylation enzyme)
MRARRPARTERSRALRSSIPDPAVDERVCAVVCAAGGSPPTLGDLRDYLRDAGISSWYWPERLELIETMPRTPMGKIRKVDLRERYPAI